MADINEMRARVEAIDAEREALHKTEEGELREFTPEDQAKFDELGAEREKVMGLLKRHEAIEAAEQMPERVQKMEAPNVSVTRDAAEVAMDRTAGSKEMADAAVRSLESKVDSDYMGSVQSLLRMHSSDREWARELLLRSTDVYASAWLKKVTGREERLTAEERTVLGVSTNANGAYFLPTAIDPTVIMTGTANGNVYRNLARKVTITNGATSWEGITSAGVTASWDGEVVEVSDDSPTFGNPTIPTYRAQAFVQASLSALEDISGLEGTILEMFADARDRLEGAAFATGSGSSQPTGVWTAVHAVTASRVTSTTAATIGLVDLNAVYEAVPARYRSRSTWSYHPVYGSAVKELGTAVSASYSGDLRDPYTGRINGLPVVESDDAPTTQTTTALDDEILLGDFNQFVVVDRPGSMSVEFIPHLFNTSNNLPDGRRGWFATWRTGSDVTNADAFRVLVDKTSV